MHHVEKGSMAERVVIVPRRGKTPQEAYAVARSKLADEGFAPIKLNSYTIDRDKLTNSETFLLRVEIASDDQRPSDESA
jgi:hypothetical protein